MTESCSHGCRWWWWVIQSNKKNHIKANRLTTKRWIGEKQSKHAFFSSHGHHRRNPSLVGALSEPRRKSSTSSIPLPFESQPKGSTATFNDPRRQENTVTMTAIAGRRCGLILPEYFTNVTHHTISLDFFSRTLSFSF